VPGSGGVPASIGWQLGRLPWVPPLFLFANGAATAARARLFRNGMRHHLPWQRASQNAAKLPERSMADRMLRSGAGPRGHRRNLADLSQSERFIRERCFSDPMSGHKVLAPVLMGLFTGCGWGDPQENTRASPTVQLPQRWSQEEANKDQLMVGGLEHAHPRLPPELESRSSYGS